MKKTLISILIICCSIFIFSCSHELFEPEHEHTFSDQWSFDVANHWHAATCEHSDLQNDLAAHVWGEGRITVEPTTAADGVKTFTCTVCSYSKTEVVPKLPDVNPADNNPADVNTGDLNPSDPNPADVNPSDSNPDDVNQADPTPADPTPSDPTPADPTPSDPTPAHIHSVGQKHEAVAGTCVIKGTLEYYDCTDCDAKLDAQGTEIDSIEGELSPSNHVHLEGKKCTACQYVYPYKAASVVGLVSDDYRTYIYLSVMPEGGIDSVSCYVILEDSDSEPVIYEGEQYSDSFAQGLSYQYKVVIPKSAPGHYYFAGIVKWSDVDIPYQLDTASDNWDLDNVNPYTGNIMDGQVLDFYH